MLLALGLGLLIGLVLGALGGGGSVLTVPALVYLLGLSAQDATSASLVIVGVSSAAAGVGYARTGRTRWRTGLLLAAVGVPASVLGSRLNRSVDEAVLLLVFAALMLVAALGMLLQPGPHEDEASVRTPRAAGVRVGASTSRARASAGARLTAAGLTIGLLTGFLGVGGGFVAVPVLVLALGLSMPVAVGTSLLVIALNSAVALLARAGSLSLDGEVVVPFTVAAVTGALLGRSVGDRVAGRGLTRGFAVLLITVALYVAVRVAISPA